MNKEEIRKAYLESVEEDIQQAETFANDPRFYKLMAVCNSPKGYSLFYPMSKEFTGKGMAFFGLCSLYRELIHCWDDDGSASWICATLSSIHPLPEKPAYVRDVVFLMNGDYVELNEKKARHLQGMILFNALFHDSSKAKVINYHARPFISQDLDFLFGLIPEWERIDKLADQNGYTYYEEGKKMDKLLAEYVNCFRD